MKLHEQVKYLKEQIEILSTGIERIRMYAQSEKYNGYSNGKFDLNNKNINRDDIILRCDEIIREANI